GLFQITAIELGRKIGRSASERYRRRSNMQLMSAIDHPDMREAASLQQSRNRCAVVKNDMLPRTQDRPQQLFGCPGNEGIAVWCCQQQQTVLGQSVAQQPDELIGNGNMFENLGTKNEVKFLILRPEPGKIAVDLEPPGPPNI